MKTVEKQRLSITVPKILLDSLDNYIQNGNGLDIVAGNFKRDYPGVARLDISKAALFKFLITSYGDKNTDESQYVAALLDNPQLEHAAVSVATDNPIIINNRCDAYMLLVNAMIWIDIPILGYYDGHSLLV